MGPRIAVLMTSFNRRQKTLGTLRSLFAQQVQHPRKLEVILVDDASTDGTAEAIRRDFPEVTVLHGTGSLFWNGGMRLAFQHALSIGYDAYLWLNDDVELSPSALDTLLETDQKLRDQGIISIVTGAMCDPQTKTQTYGGTRRIWRFTHFRHFPVAPSVDEPVACDTMNGNCTLIPREIADKIGNLEPGFQHHFGDIDYGYRAKRAGFAVHVAPGFVAECPTNSTKATWRDPSASIKQRWKDILSPKGYRYREWLLFTKRHYSYLWPLYFAFPYIKASLPARSISHD